MSSDLTQEPIEQEYLNFYKKNNKPPTLADFNQLGITREEIRQRFTNLQKLHAHMRSNFADSFSDIPIEDLLATKVVKEFETDLKKYKRFVITTAVLGCQVNQEFLNSIKNYCKLKEAKLLVLTCADPAKRNSSWSTLGHIDKSLQDYVVTKEISLNNNLFLCSIKTSAKQINTLTGLLRIVGRSKSFIAASPKIFVKVVPGANHQYPKVALTTGAITNADYQTEMYMSERTAYLGDMDHKLGAVVVEIESKDKFHFRHIEALSDGSFIDLGTQYTQDSTLPATTDVVVYGDWHSGSTDSNAKRMGEEVCKLTNPKYLVLHDLFDGNSINHHEAKNLISKAYKASTKKLDSLEHDLQSLRKDLEELSSLAPNLCVIKSNHDEFLDRYLKDGRYINDPVNYKLALKLSLFMLEGKDPLQEGLKEVGFKMKNVKFLGRDDDLIVGKRQFGNHGDIGANGSRGNLRNMETCYGPSCSGHTHTMGRDRDSLMVGTFSKLRLGYNRGPSSWTHTLAVQYRGDKGKVAPIQLITCIDGTWRIE